MITEKVQAFFVTRMVILLMERSQHFSLVIFENVRHNFFLVHDTPISFFTFVLLGFYSLGLYSELIETYCSLLEAKGKVGS